MIYAKEKENPTTIGVSTFVLQEVAVLAKVYEGLLKAVLK
jgi:hypothetical protein